MVNITVKQMKEIIKAVMSSSKRFKPNWSVDDPEDPRYIFNKPKLFSGSYNDLSDKPAFSDVATSGSYNDLSDQPTIPDLSTFDSVQKGNYTLKIGEKLYTEYGYGIEVLGTLQTYYGSTVIYNIYGTTINLQGGASTLGKSESEGITINPNVSSSNPASIKIASIISGSNRYVSIDADGHIYSSGHQIKFGNNFYNTTLKFINDPVDDNDAANKKYVDSILPTVSADDAGKFLRVSSTGEWIAESISNASGVSF